MLTAALAAAAVIALVVGVWAAVEGPPPVWWRFVACAALFILAGLASFSMRFGSHKVLFWWSEVAVVVSLMMLPLGWVVLATALGAAAKALRRRHQPLKAVFNAALDIAAVGFVVALLSLSGWAPLQVTELGDLVAVIAAALIYSQLTEVCTALVIGLSQGRSPLAIYRAGLTINLVSQAGNMAAAGLAVVLVRVDPRVMLVLPPLLFCLQQAYEARLR